MDKVNIVCTGMLDTKGTEIKYLADMVKFFGGNSIVMDLSLGHENDWADVSLAEVLKMTQTLPEDVFSMPRSSAFPVVGKAAALKIDELYRLGRVDGIISWAGTIGASTVTYAMRALPIGVPKIMLCTGASGDVSGWLENSDILISNPISEKGINKITKKTVAPAVAGVVAMAKARKRLDEGVTATTSNPLAAVTLYGTTTRVAARCASFLETRGWDVLFIHQTGTGATMEDLIRSGDIVALFDLTPGELTNTAFQSVYGVPDTWKGERFTAAFDMGIPCVASAGGLDQVAYGTRNGLPGVFMQDFEEGRRVSLNNCKKPFIHASSTTIIPTTVEETAQFARYMVERFNRAKGKSVFLIPMRGWSAYDQSRHHARDKDMGWSADSDAPVWIADSTNQEWSARAVAMWEVFSKCVVRDNPNIDILKCDLHILDDCFGDFANIIMGDILDEKWEKGMYRNLPYVIT